MLIQALPLIVGLQSVVSVLCSLDHNRQQLVLFSTVDILLQEDRAVLLQLLQLPVLLQESEQFENSEHKFSVQNTEGDKELTHPPRPPWRPRMGGRRTG